MEGFTNNILLPFQTAEVQKTVVTNATKNSTGYGDRTTNDDEPTKIIKPIQSDGASINVANQQQLKSTGNDDLASSPSSFKPANGVATLHRSPQAPGEIHTPFLLYLRIFGHNLRFTNEQAIYDRMVQITDTCLILNLFS